MVDINRLSRLVGGVSKQVDLQQNTLVVGSLKVGSSSPTELTKAILDQLISGVFPDSTFRISDDGDSTKKIAFQASGISASTTRTISMPDADVNLGALTNSNIASGAAIAYSKLNLTNSLVDADVASGAAIAYSKLSLTSSIVNADIAAAAAISFSKMAALTASRALVSDGSGVVSASSVSSTELGHLVGVTSAIQTQIDGKVAKAGDTMSGNLNLGGNKILSLGAPTSGTDATNKNYVDAAIGGLSWKDRARVATTANVALVPAPASIDGVTLVSGDRVLVKNQSTASENGIYSFNGTDLVRASDADASAELESAAVFVASGTANADTAWVQSTDSVNLGVSSLVFVQFAGNGTIQAGTGLAYSGNTLNVNLGAGIVELPSDEVGLDLHSSSGLFLTLDGSTANATNAAQLSVKLDGSTLAKSGNGLKVADDSISNVHINSAAAISYSKLNLSSSIVNADIAAAAAIARSKLASGSANHVLINDGSGVMSSEARLSLSRFADSDAGKVLVAQGSGVDSSYQAISGDATLSSAGVLTVNQSKNLKNNETAGESMLADTTFAVRYALNGETAGRMYKADKDSSSVNKCLVVGLASKASAVSAGDSVVVVNYGPYTLASGDATFGASDIGKEVYLTAAGAFSLTAPSAADEGVCVIGVVADTNKIFVQPRFVGVN